MGHLEYFAWWISCIIPQLLFIWQRTENCILSNLHFIFKCIVVQANGKTGVNLEPSNSFFPVHSPSPPTPPPSTCLLAYLSFSHLSSAASLCSIKGSDFKIEHFSSAFWEHSYAPWVCILGKKNDFFTSRAERIRDERTYFCVEMWKFNLLSSFLSAWYLEPSQWF